MGIILENHGVLGDLPLFLRVVPDRRAQRGARHVLHPFLKSPLVSKRIFYFLRDFDFGKHVPGKGHWEMFKTNTLIQPKSHLNGNQIQQAKISRQNKILFDRK